MDNTNSDVDKLFRRAPRWQPEFERLRAIIREFPLTEEVKWWWPCYSLNGANVVLMHGFNEYCALLFFKGALMKDPNHILVQQTENVQSGRQIRFTSLQQIAEMEPVLKAYLAEAIETEKAGLKLDRLKAPEINVPDELQNRMDEQPSLRAAFEALTPGRRRAYCLFFSDAKQPRTRESRIDKCVDRILEGKGLDDR